MNERLFLLWGVVLFALGLWVVATNSRELWEESAVNRGVWLIVIGLMLFGSGALMWYGHD